MDLYWGTRHYMSLLMSLFLWWGDMTNVQVVKLFFMFRQRGITVATSPNRSASSSRMMIMKTNGSLAWRWNHMRITVCHKHACVSAHTHTRWHKKKLPPENGTKKAFLLCVLMYVGDSRVLFVPLHQLFVMFANGRQKLKMWCHCLLCCHLLLFVATMTCQLISPQPFEALSKTILSVIIHFQRRSTRPTFLIVVSLSAKDIEEWPMCTHNPPPHTHTHTHTLLHLPMVCLSFVS